VVTVAGTTYAVVDALWAIRRIPSPYAKAVSTLISACRTAGHYGFFSTSGVGVVAWLPSNPFNCFALPVVGGGPTTEPCFQMFRTPDRQFYVVFAGTNARTCANLSAEAPGGWRSHTTRAVQGLPRGSNIIVKCQRVSQGYLVDYVAPPIASALPASRNAYWIYDAWVATGYTWLPNVPKCVGLNIRF
jgi:hypothetical protein